MKRMIDYHLLNWKNDPLRKPLLLRGARQIGKTFAARQLGKTFADCVEINLEQLKNAAAIFEKDLVPNEMIADLSILVNKPIVPGKTLLFIDEIQAVPRAVTSLRYFYELMPELHVIAAGSLLDFALNEVGAPVGRVQSLYMYPLSFIEFLVAVGETLAVERIVTHPIEKEMSPVIHKKILELVGKYAALGGMPEVVDCWRRTKKPLDCTNYHTQLLDYYRQDFNKYARERQIKYVKTLFDAIPRQLGKKFKYSSIEGGYRKRELAPALDLLETAAVARKVHHSSSQGLPLGAEIDPLDYKVIFLDVGLAQALLDLSLADWFLEPLAQLTNKGSIIEAFVGQELLANSSPDKEKNLYYWNRETPGSQAEVDYVIQKGNDIIPIEVKSGRGTTLKSLHSFLERHPHSHYGMRFSVHNYSIHGAIHSYPLYAIFNAVGSSADNVRSSIEAMLA